MVQNTCGACISTTPNSTSRQKRTDTRIWECESPFGESDFCVDINLSGKIGLSAFSYIVRDPRTRGIPLVLETPSEDDPGVAGVWAVEVGALHDLAEDTQTGSTPAHASEGTSLR